MKRNEKGWEQRGASNSLFKLNQSHLIGEIMSISDKLGLVSHWIGFITGVTFAIVIIWGGYSSVMYIYTITGGDIRAAYVFELLLLAIAVLLLPLLLGWLIRYTLSGKVKILPFQN